MDKPRKRIASVIDNIHESIIWLIETGMLADARGYRARNKEKIAERNKKYYLANKESLLEYTKEYHFKNKDILATKSKEYYLANRERRLANNREYRAKNKDKLAAQRKGYRLNNRERIAMLTSKPREISTRIFINNAKNICQTIYRVHLNSHSEKHF